MRPASVEALHLRLGCIEHKADGTQGVLLVRMTTDMGIVGHGEATSHAMVARGVVEAPFRNGLGVTLVRTDPLDPGNRWQAANRGMLSSMDPNICVCQMQEGF